jgi:hypothetical protein
MLINYQNLNCKYAYKKRSLRGQAIAESGPVLWALLIGLMFPALCLASLFYRCVFVYFATRDSCYKAAKSSTFSNGQTNATTAFNNAMAAFNGISGTEQLFIIEQPLAGGAYNTYSSAHTANTTLYVYFLQAQTTATIQPLFSMGPSWLGISVPGLTGPYNITVVCKFYVENPQGLGT